MFSMIKKVTSFCNFLLDRTLLSRIKVFYQILILILIMVFFLWVQGNMGLKIINNMHQTTLSVFDQSVRGQSDISSAKLQLEQVKSGYLAILAEKSESNTLSYSGLEEVLVRIRNLESNDQSAIGIMNTSFAELKSILEQPVNASNYLKLLPIIDSMMLSLNILDDSARNFGLQTLSLGTTYTVSSRRNTFIIMLISGFIALAFGLTIAGSISHPLKKIERAAQDLAVGNLANEISAKGCAEVSGMANALNKAIKGLRALV
ncbi:MAG: HAMP domain-containing protein, partial [Bacteroidota bacterium]